MEYVIFLLLCRTLPRTSCYMVNRPRKKICLIGEFAYPETLLAIDFFFYPSAGCGTPKSYTVTKRRLISSASCRYVVLAAIDRSVF